ncbi:tetratricopeptide repeat protein [Micromonospora taraxaci]|uniref:tetratricopeptide repeat protein n=1 Tax=Micromonospora taraxaci TaxID=1316803 RepID=UPI0033B4CA81
MTWRSPATTGQQIIDSIVVGRVIQIRDVAGNVTVVADRAPYQVEAFEPGAVPLPAGIARRQPSRLLLARHQMVPFIGRDTELEVLDRWMGGDEPVSVRLIHAAGGQGKTRLARHVAAQANTAGWMTWRVLHALGQQPTGSPEEMSASAGALVVVDYADRWQASDLNRLITDMTALSLRTGLVLRMLLLARSAGFWWSALRDRIDSDHGILAEAQALPPLDEHTDRRVLFEQACERFSAALDVPDTASITVPDLTDAGFRQILAVHMAALVAVDSHHHGHTPPTQPHALSAYLLNRERAHWHHLHARTEDRRATSPEIMGRAVYLATLTGGITRADAITVLTRTQVTEPGATTIIDDHQFCYPASAPHNDTVLRPLRPDRLGEDLIALSTPGHSHTGADDWPPDDWAATAAHTLLTGDLGTWTPTAITVLVETAHRWPHVAATVLYPLIRQHPELALTADGTTITRLADLPHVDITALQAIEALLPQRHIDLDTASAAVNTTLTHHRLGLTSDPAEQAKLLATHALHLNNAGHRSDALAPAEEAVGIYRRLAEANPTTYLPDLANSINNRAAYLSGVGRRDQALAPTEEAVTIRRRLAEVNPAAYLPDLASSLNNLGALLSAVGRHNEALTPAEEAVGIHRRLAEVNPTAYLPDLTMSLSNLGAILLEVGRRDQALTWTEEAVTIRRRLAEVNPAAYLPDLANSLNNLGAALSGVGRRNEALPPTEEAVGIYRRLAKVNPTAYLPDLANSLNNLGIRLSEVGRRDQALAPTETAVTIRRLLAEVNPTAYLPNLATSLNNLGIRLSEVGRRDQALVPTEEAVAIRRRLAEVNPTAYLRDLASSLHNLGATLSEVGRREQALAPTEEAVAIRRRLAEVNPAAHLPDLATSLINLGIHLSKVGRREQALPPAEEAVGIYRRLAEVNRAVHLPDLAHSLGAYAWVCVNLNDNLPAALDSVNEAIRLYKPMTERLPHIFMGQLFAAYRTLADVLERLGRADEAANVRRHLDQDPDEPQEILPDSV